MEFLDFWYALESHLGIYRIWGPVRTLENKSSFAYKDLSSADVYGALVFGNLIKATTLAGGWPKSVNRIQGQSTSWDPSVASAVSISALLGVYFRVPISWKVPYANGHSFLNESEFRPYCDGVHCSPASSSGFWAEHPSMV